MILPKGIAQITIRDENDITISSTAPASPVANQMWLDTSTTPSVLKRYNGTAWDIVNDIKTGGRNLLADSKSTAAFNSFTGGTNTTMFYRTVTLTPEVKAGDRITVSMTYKYTNIVLVSGQEANAKLYVQGSGNVTSWSPGFTSGPNALPYMTKGNATELQYYQVYTFVLTAAQATNKTFSVGFRADYIQSGTLSIFEMKVESGDKDTGWTPSPEDVDNKIASVVSIANGKNTVYYSTAAPAGTKVENDIWFDTDDGNKMYRYTSGAWVAAQFGTSAISANSITGNNIAGTTITAGNLATGAVTADKIYGLSVTTDKLAANAVTAGKIAVNAVEAGSIAANAITTEKINASAITGVKLNAQDIWANTAFVNYFKATSIDANQITTGKISGERIDITGLISYEALDTTLQPIFSVTSGKTYINGGMIAANTIKANSIDLLSGLTVMGPDNEITFAISADGGVTVNALLQSGNFDDAKKTGYRISTDGTAILNQALMRGRVELPNAGMTDDYSGSNVQNPVRIWAGSSYELRDTAPFRVLQNGDVYATNATLSGILYGEVDSGMVNIYDDEILIANDSTNPVTEYVKMNVERSMFNNNIIFGTISDPRLSYINADRTMNIKNTSTIIDNPNIGVSMNNTSTWSSALELNSNLTGQDGTIAFGYSTGVWANTLIVTSKGSQGSTYGDIHVRRLDTTEKVSVTVAGDVDVRNSITSSLHAIEMRSVSGEGWGFYAN